MQLTNLLGLCLLGLASTAAAMPRFGRAYHGDRISVHVPANSTGAHNATTVGTATKTGTRGKIPLATGSSTKDTNGRHVPPTHVPNNHHVPNHIKHINHCNELCSLESQTCSIAMPEDDKYW